jgi:hypothetical protein
MLNDIRVRGKHVRTKTKLRMIVSTSVDGRNDGRNELVQVAVSYILTFKALLITNRATAGQTILFKWHKCQDMI